MQYVGLAAFPKSGVTYLSSLLYYTFFDGANPDDIERSYVVDIHIGDVAAAVAHEDRVFFKSHYALGDQVAHGPMPSRALYLIRDPVDVMRSAHDYLRMVGASWASMAPDDFAAEWIGSSGAGFDVCGPWPHHVRSWLEQDEVPVLLVRYTDLVDRPREQLARITRFLDLQPTAAAIEHAIASSTMSAMRAREEDAIRSKRDGVFYNTAVAEAKAKGARFINKGYRGSDAGLDVGQRALADRNFGAMRRAYLRGP